MELKVYLKSLLWFILPLLFLILITNTFYYFDLLDNTIIKFLKIFIVIISAFISGFVRGYYSNNKGYINGIKLSLLIIFFLIIISVIIKKITLSSLLYYIIILLTITFGSMVGINKKKN